MKLSDGYPLVMVAVVLFLSGCSQAGPAPASTSVPSAPVKVAEPTKAPAAAPVAPTAAPTAVPPQATSAPVKKVDFPQKGRSITLLVPYAPGGNIDISARLLAPLLEKELGSPVEVVNKAGAGSQIALTELFLSKPDGYTVSYAVIPTVLTHYLDPERKAPYTRTSFQPVALQYRVPNVLAVAGNGPYKTLKDFIDAAKADPEKVKVASTGIMTTSHLSIMQLQQAAGVRFAVVQFEGGAPALTSVLGAHTDAVFDAVSSFASQVKSGDVRVLGVGSNMQSQLLPNVPSMASQGYDVSIAVGIHGIIAPGGTPREIVDILSAAIKKAGETDTLKQKMAEQGAELTYMDPDKYAAFWAESEKTIAPLIELAKKQ